MTLASPAAMPTERPHFVVLDGMRGVAAFCVVLFHFTMSFCNMGWGICHGFLAVDFFFCLSGYVLGYAYSDRLELIGWRRFMLLRLVRLHPLVVLGSVLGFGAFCAEALQRGMGLHVRTLTATCIASALLIPFPAGHNGLSDLFRLNVPAWSLFWEYVASALFCVALFRIRRRALVALTGLAALNLCYAGHLAGSLKGGADLFGMPMGGARVAFSFSMGLLLARLRWRWRTPAGLTWLSVLLVSAFVLPFTPGDWMRECAVVVLYFPVLVLLGAGAIAGQRTSRVCQVLGRLSYPLYMTHYPVVRLWSLFVEQHRLTAVDTSLATASGILCTLALSWLALHYWDEPVRGYLHRVVNRRWPIAFSAVALT